ncbi:MAG TPA: hypothetical protein VHE37_09820, partial [Nevskiaceae bacterium]|nr:hypothetical protein [Nevskiaceae bacterium]
FIDNYAHDNVGGFLIFDLPGRVQFGEKNIVHQNKSYHNNIKSFAPRGAIVGDVPSGTGALVLASDQLEFYDNDVQDNDTVGLTIVNYGLVDNNEDQRRYDYFPEGMHIYNNTFTNNGGNPQLPDPNKDTCTGPNGLPGPSDDPSCISNNATLLVTIIQLKNGGHSAQIVWDGGLDSDTGCTDIPVDSYGVPLTQPDPQDTTRYEARHDERGRPNLYQYDPLPKCKYNHWKFNDDGSLKKPANGMCIENNTFVTKFDPQRPGALAVNDFTNIHFSTADPTAAMNLVPAEATPLSTPPHDCPIADAPLLVQYVPVLGSFTPNPADDPRASDAQISQVCGGGEPGKINYAALAQFNCPKLSDYGLFADPADPTKNPNGFGVPFNLNTILFSDYAVKSRFLFLPPDASGNVQKATYEDHQQCDTINIYDCYTATLGFPVGTVFAKTFAFRNQGSPDNVVETRLLIKRQHADGSVYWVAFAYEWQTVNGVRQALLKLEGDTQGVSWNYDDEDPNAKDASGTRLHYQGSTPNYGVPNAGACLLCHGGDDREPGAAPIGPKVRNLNKDYTYADGTTANQLTYLAARGLLDLPAGKTADQLEKLPKFNVIGSGDASDTANDEHLRVRAFLEVNCMHCHNPAGAAQNSGLSLDSFTEPMDEGHGICKPPIAAGKAADNVNYDIVPGSSGGSLLAVRVNSTQPGIKMPPLARTVVDTEAANLITHWIDNVVSAHADPNANKCGTGSSTLPVPLMKVIPATPAQKAPFG